MSLQQLEEVRMCTNPQTTLVLSEIDHIPIWFDDLSRQRLTKWFNTAYRNIQYCCIDFCYYMMKGVSDFLPREKQNVEKTEQKKQFINPPITATKLTALERIDVDSMLSVVPIPNKPHPSHPIVRDFINSSSTSFSSSCSLSTVSSSSNSSNHDKPYFVKIYSSLESISANRKRKSSVLENTSITKMRKNDTCDKISKDSNETISKKNSSVPSKEEVVSSSHRDNNDPKLVELDIRIEPSTETKHQSPEVKSSEIKNRGDITIKTSGKHSDYIIMLKENKVGKLESGTYHFAIRIRKKTPTDEELEKSVDLSISSETITTGLSSEDSKGPEGADGPTAKILDLNASLQDKTQHAEEQQKSRLLLNRKIHNRDKYGNDPYMYLSQIGNAGPIVICTLQDLQNIYGLHFVTNIEDLYTLRT